MCGSASIAVISFNDRQSLVFSHCKSYLLSILRRKVRNSICIAPVELAPVGFCSIPFHSILGCDGTKLGAANDVLLGVVIANGQRGANV